MPPDGLNVAQLNLSDGGKHARVSCRDGFSPTKWPKILSKNND
ncbi:hypothetical protein K3495_g1040 [Podosphaera aphanis]|nr:hypothetical protein K3495_g1040 [Podosphaera aphanis]